MSVCARQPANPPAGCTGGQPDEWAAASEEPAGKCTRRLLSILLFYYSHFHPHSHSHSPAHSRTRSPAHSHSHPPCPPAGAHAGSQAPPFGRRRSGFCIGNLLQSLSLGGLRAGRPADCPAASTSWRLRAMSTKSGGRARVMEFGHSRRPNRQLYLSVRVASICCGLLGALDSPHPPVGPIRLHLLAPVRAWLAGAAREPPVPAVALSSPMIMMNDGDGKRTDGRPLPAGRPHVGALGFSRAAELNRACPPARPPSRPTQIEHLRRTRISR